MKRLRDVLWHFIQVADPGTLEHGHLASHSDGAGLGAALSKLNQF